MKNGRIAMAFCASCTDWRRSGSWNGTGLAPISGFIGSPNAGRLRALGGRDPEKCWKRKWDGYWRVVVFDISAKEDKTRNALHYYLRNHGFGCLQRSVWITPDAIDDVKKDMAPESAKVKSMAFLKAQLCGGERNEQIVRAAWDFGRIHELYDDYLAVLARKPPLRSADFTSAKAFQAWIAEERQAWASVMSKD